MTDKTGASAANLAKPAGKGTPSAAALAKQAAKGTPSAAVLAKPAAKGTASAAALAKAGKGTPSAANVAKPAGKATPSQAALAKTTPSGQVVKSDQDMHPEPSSLDPVLEVNEAISEEFEKLLEVGEFEENPPKIFSIHDVLEPLTIESLNNVIYELGVVNMCWPEIKEPVFETRTCFPVSYYTNSKKERLLLAYAENFRRQYHFNFKYDPCYRKNLFLQAPNDCGMQKMVCTTIRSTKLCYTGTNTWQGLAALVADYFVYEPLTKPMLHPDRLISPYSALVRRAGNPFEIAHVLVSWLIGATYDAYVVVGCAARDTCLNIRYRILCPDVPDEKPPLEVEPENVEEPRYKLVPLPDFTSKYVQMMQDRADKKIQDELDKLEAERQAKIAELELPPPDEIDGWRTHAWVMVMPGPMGVEEPFFIEPAEGNAYPLSCLQYQQIDSLYNDENYYVNLQILGELIEEEEIEEDIFEKELHDIKEKELEKKEIEEKEERKRKKKEEREQREADAEEKAGQKKKKKKKEKKDKDEDEIKEMMKRAAETYEATRSKPEIVEEAVEEAVEEEEREIIWQNLSHFKYDLTDLTCWEHLLAGEPTNRRQLVGVDCADKRTAVITEKHLDVPTSWVEKLDISASDFEQRYPGCHKTIHYKKVLVEFFSRYSERDGIVKRIKTYEDYALTIPLITYEYYSNREDKMDLVRIDHIKNEVREEFLTGRPDNMLIHTYAIEAPPLSIEAHRSMEFKWYSRQDHLQKIVCTPLTFEEFYEQREDLLISRHIEYTEGTKADPKRNLKTVTEIYHRNYDIPAKDDIWKRIFHIQDNKIELQHHYEYNFVTNDFRWYEKPNLAETGGKILFYPDKTSGYIADANAFPPRDLSIYYGLCDNMTWEYATTKHIRESEADVNTYLKQRYKELTEPVLYVSLFNTERNEDAQKGFAEMEKLKAEVAEREKEADIDPLQPYIARMFGSSKIAQALSVKEATLIREQCVNDFKTKQLARQILVQERFDKLNAEYKAKRLWYLANQFILTPEKESAYFALSAELSFQVHSLEVRLTRHRDLSGPRFKALEKYLDKHPLLFEYIKARAFHKAKQSVAKSRVDST